MRSFTLVVGFLLAAHPVASQTRGTIEGRSKLFYESLGKGPETIVVVHGGPGVAHDYLRPEWDQLAASGAVDWGHVALIIGVPAIMYSIVSSTARKT